MALRRYKTLEEVRDGRGRQVGQLAGIEERTRTGTALFEPDMRLLGVDQSIHRTGAARAPIVLDLAIASRRSLSARLGRVRQAARNRSPSALVH